MDSLTIIDLHQRKCLALSAPRLYRSFKLVPSNQIVSGVKTDLSLNDCVEKYGGKRIKKVFTVLILRSVLKDNLSDGDQISDDLGKVYVIIGIISDVNWQIITCVGF
jgi:hypothetical protein